MNEVKEVKGIMILNADGNFWSKEIYENIKEAESEVVKTFGHDSHFLFSIARSFNFVTVTAKIEIMGAA